MALQYNYFVEQEGYTREVPLRVYGYQSSYPPSVEMRADEFERYPSFSKIFNNQPSFGEADFGGQYRMSQQAPSQSLSKKSAPHQRVRFVEQREEVGGGGGHRKKEVDHVGEKTVDRDAGWFIDWKRKSLQTSKTFAD